jgi:hypothetical protein
MGLQQATDHDHGHYGGEHPTILPRASGRLNHSGNLGPHGAADRKLLRCIVFRHLHPSAARRDVLPDARKA